MNFNVHRRNRSLVSQNKLLEKRDHRSNKKVGQPPPGETLLQQAKDLYYSQSNLEQTVRLFEQYLSLYPRHNQSLYLCAVSHLHLNQSQQAIDKLMNISDEYENKPNAMLLAAMAYNKLNNISKSIDIVNDCIKRYEHFEEAICFRGKIYMNMNSYQKAEQDFRQSIAIPKASFLSYVGLADCYRFQGKIEKALNYYYRALEVLATYDNVREDSHKPQIQLKIAICLYQLEKYPQSHHLLQNLTKVESLKSSELFYYLGQSEIKLNMKQKGLMNLQYCLRLQTNDKIIRKAYKKLILLYVENNQYYQALNIVKLGEICNLNLDSWKIMVESFMLIIKGHYEEGVKNLTKIWEQMKQTEEIKRIDKIDKIKMDVLEDKSRRGSRYHQQSCDFTKKATIPSPSYRGKDIYSKQKVSKKKMGYFSTKTVVKAVPKIESTRLHIMPLYKRDDTPKFKTQHNFKDIKQQKALFSSEQKQMMYPLILLFKAYGQFFLNSFQKALDTYEEYESYIKDVFGRESDVFYNKCLCEALLMAESDMQDEALVKYSNCVDFHYEKYGNIPPQPLLYKIVLLMKLALVKNDDNDSSDSDDEASSSYQQILQSTLNMIENYDSAIGTHHLTHYYKSLIYILLDKYEESGYALERALKITEQCSWKILYVKGVVEMILGNYYDAVKEFSAGLLVENRPELYLGRSISFLLLSEKELNLSESKSTIILMKSVHISSELTSKNEKSNSKENTSNRSDILLENCFEDLQKYIELESNQEQISIWVSKILFVNKAYDEAIRSLTKISNQTEEILSMIECIQIYQGEFENGGFVGYIIKSAFDGQYLTEEEESKLLGQKIVKNYNSFQYGYLTSDYEKWLIILHLYAKQNFAVLLKYLQKEIFSCQDDFSQVLLRYNVAIVYLLMGSTNKGLNVIKGLTKYEEKYDLKKRIAKMVNREYDQDECIDELKQEIGINCNKLLSSYLPYRPIKFINHKQEHIRIYTKINIPFPKFANPSLELKITPRFIVKELSSSNVQKKIQAPWIKKIKNKNVQFTEKLQESVSGLDSVGITNEMKPIIIISDI